MRRKRGFERTIFSGQVISAKKESMKLPEPSFSSRTSLEKALLRRRSVRDYDRNSLTVEEIGQLLWAAQGVTEKWGGRTAPSAGALYPLEIYLLAGEVKGLKTGLYHYRPGDHSISPANARDLRPEITEASLNQDQILKAPATLVICAVYERTTEKYGQRGVRYVHQETGSVCQNVHLQAESLNLGTVWIGAFDDQQVKQALGIAEEPLAIMPVGKK
jgi:SagB-type dehydrogenase family enzyme